MLRSPITLALNSRGILKGEKNGEEEGARVGAARRGGAWRDAYFAKSRDTDSFTSENNIFVQSFTRAL